MAAHPLHTLAAVAMVMVGAILGLTRLTLTQILAEWEDTLLVREGPCHPAADLLQGISSINGDSSGG